MPRGASSASRLPAIAAAALAGNVTVHLLPVLPQAAWAWPIGLAAIAALSTRRLRLFGCFLAAASLTLSVARASLDARWPPAGEARDVALEGYVDGFPDVNDERAAFSFRVIDAADRHVPGRVRLSWYDPPEDLDPGASLAIVARLRAPRGLVNPGAFDYERWLFVEGYGATGYVRSGRVVEDRWYGLAQRWLGFRGRLAERIDRAVGDEKAAALIVALSLGERGRFSDAQWETLRRTGTSHLVAISGMHIGLIAALTFALVSRAVLWLPYALARHAASVAAIASVVPAGVYAALAGFALPTERALVMVVVAQIVVLSRRHAALAPGLSMALLVVLALDPIASLEASFWLSFGAVGLILAIAQRTAASPKVPRARWLRSLRAFCGMQWGLTLGLAPLVVIFFGALSLVSFPVNLVAIPFFSLILVPMSLATALLAQLGLASPIVHAGAALADLAWLGLESAAALPHAAILLVTPGGLAALAAVIGVLFGLPRHPLPGRRLAWLGLLPLVVPHPGAPGPGEADLTVLDVGHGLAVLIETESHRLLYDAGPLYRSGFDAGEEVVVPVLENAGIAELDMLMLSHADSDHAGGAAAVLRAYPTARLVRGPDFPDDGTEQCRAGDAWFWDGVRFEVLHPPAGFGPRGNESSCVLKVTALHGSMLLTGDIEARGERALADTGALAADVVIVPHHGSATSSSRDFVEAVAPRFAIVSAGFDNRWGFPKDEVRRRWQDLGASVLVTGDEGAIGLRLGAGDWEPRLERRARPRYWRAETPPSSGTPTGGAL